MQEKLYFVYILASSSKRLYVGVTSNLMKRIWEHKNKVAPGFTQQYNIDQLVYFETTTNILAAIEREKQLKHWKREWKLELIQKNNPAFHDLSKEFTVE